MSLSAYENILKAVADPTRVRILKMLEGGELCVCQVIAVIGLGQSTISKHLFLLKSAGLVQDRRDKKWIHYSLARNAAPPYAARALRNLKEWLNDDPVVRKDRERTALARAIGPVAICERGLTLPARRRTGASVPSSRKRAETGRRRGDRG